MKNKLGPPHSTSIPIMCVCMNLQTCRAQFVLQQKAPVHVQSFSLPHKLSVCLSVWVYPGHMIHHYNGRWATCAPGRRNMHHSGAICTTVHKGDYVTSRLSPYVCPSVRSLCQQEGCFLKEALSRFYSIIIKAGTLELRVHWLYLVWKA